MTDEEKQKAKKQIRKIVTKKLQEISNEIFYSVCTRMFDEKVIDAIDKTYGEEIAKCYDVLLNVEE